MQKISLHKTLGLLLLLMLCLPVWGQKDFNSATVEQKTYQLYTEQNWNGVIKEGKAALKHRIDYYYLRMRIGIAYFEKKNYLQAEKHFRQALKFNSDDALAKEYIYYCYLYSSRYEEARLYSKNFDTTLREKTGTLDPKAIDFVMMEGGTKIADSTAYYDTNKKTYTNYYDPATYVQVGLGHYVKDRFSMFHAATYFSQKNFIGTIKQYQYYVKATIPFNRGWRIAPAYHFVGGTFTSIITPMPKPGAPPPRSETTTTNFNEHVASLTVQKRLGGFTIDLLNTYIASSSGSYQLINGLSLDYAPFGNNKLVFGPNYYISTDSAYSNISHSIGACIFSQPVPRFWIKTGFLINDTKNIVEDDGYLVNNSPDLTTSRAFVMANVFLHPKFALYGLYQLENKTENVQKFHYRYNVMVVGVKFVP